MEHLAPKQTYELVSKGSFIRKSFWLPRNGQNFAKHITIDRDLSIQVNQEVRCTRVRNALIFETRNYTVHSFYILLSLSCADIVFIHF